MGSTTHTLKFRADSREVKVMGQTIEKAFDPKSSRAFRRELGHLQTRMKDITAAQVGLVKEMSRVEEGTEAYKAFKSQLDAVADQAKTVKSAIGGITSAFKDFNAEKRRGFGAGMAQGMGVAQYIPSEAGMGRRIAGGMVGGGIRRAAGAAAAPLRNPGIGGLSTALGAIPIVGQMAAGAVQSLSGMYQEAVAFHQSRVGNLQYMQGGAVAATERAMGAGISGATALRAGAGRKIMGKGGHLTKQGRQMAGFAREDLATAISDPNNKSPYVLRARKALAKEQKREMISQGIAAPARAVQETVSNLGEIANFVGDKFGVKTGWKGGPKVVASRRQIGEKYQKAKSDILDTVSVQMVKDIAGDAKKKARKERAKRFSKAFWKESVRLPGAGFGSSMGYRGAETQAELGGFMGARGGGYTRRARYQFRGALAAKRVYGIQAQTAGSYSRMGLEGGGGQGNMGLATTLQMAFELGLRGSQIPDYLQSLVSLGQTAEKQGVKINERDFGRSASLMKSVGLRGPQIGRVTAGVNSAAMDLSSRGVSSPVDMIMMRAAGYDPSQGIEGYAAASNKMAGGMDMETLNNLMGMATQGASGGTGAAGRETKIFNMRRFFGRMKVGIGPGQASTMLDAYQGGKLNREHLLMMNRDINRGERAGAHGRMISGAKTGVGMVAGLTKTEAGMEAQRIHAGSRFAGVMKNLNQTTINVANATNNFNKELGVFTGWMNDLTKKLGEVTKGGSEGILEAIKKKIFGEG